MKKYLCSALVAAAFLAPITATAQNAAPAPSNAGTPVPSVGARVYDPEGAEVGTVESVQGDIVTVNTGSARAGLPTRAFAVREKGLTIAMTKVQLETAAAGANAQAQGARDAALVDGATVKGSDGVAIGTITQIVGDDVTVQLADGASAIIRKPNIGLVDGALTIGVTAATFIAQVHAPVAR